jgi:hypothetical protein
MMNRVSTLITGVEGIGHDLFLGTIPELSETKDNLKHFNVWTLDRDSVQADYITILMNI